MKSINLLVIPKVNSYFQDPAHSDNNNNNKKNYDSYSEDDDSCFVKDNQYYNP